MKVPYQFNNKSYTSNYIFILIKTIYKQYSLLLYIDFMPIYPVIDYRCYCCYCLWTLFMPFCLPASRQPGEKKSSFMKQ